MKNGRIIISIGTGAVIAGLVLVSIISFLYRANFVTGTVIAQDVKKLGQIFDKINKTCGISSFDNQQNIINFLNVATFAGSEVGAMNLAYPDKWEGPYVQDNLEVQGKEYMVVKTKTGYFVTPGNGVKLPNGAIIGEAIILNEHADIAAMMANRNKLLFQGRPLAARIFLQDSKPGSEVWGMNY